MARSLADVADTAETASGPPPPASRARLRPHRKKFLAAYALLALIVAGAIGGLALLLAKGGPNEGPPWSAWRPEGTDDQMAQMIASHVGSGYRLSSGRQLVGVQVAPPRVQDIPLGAIAVRRPPPGGTGNVSVDVFQADNTQVYILCGLGQNCAIVEGKPSTARLQLLRREGLELALYTFRYIEGKDRVVVFLPPAPGSRPIYALFFQRGDLEPELARPLRATLPNPSPPLPGRIPPGELATIDRLTEPGFFRFSFQQLQDGTAVLVLDDLSLPPPAQSGSSQQPAQQGTTTQ